MQLERGPLLADSSLKGTEWCARHSALIDDWLTSLLAAAVLTDRGFDAVGISLVAVGGYGRSELCPQSDLDVMLLRSPRRDVKAIAERIWYPIWDSGMKLGHSVCTQREALEIAESDLDTATALLSARHVAGDAALTMDLKAAARTQWERRSKKWLEALDAAASKRATRKQARSRSCSSRISRKVAADCATCIHCTGLKPRARSSSNTTS